MPSYTRNKKRDQIVYVTINDILLYGFKTKDLSAIGGITSANLLAIGHLDAAAAAAVVAGVRVFGVNSPKPPRVTKRLNPSDLNSQSSVSTFCGHNKIAAAQGLGFNLTKKPSKVNLKGASTFRRSLTAVAELSNGVNYAFPMNAADYTAYGAALGLKTAATITTEAEKKMLITGSNGTRPGRAQLAIGDGTASAGTIQTYFSTDQESTLATAGWQILESEVVFDPAGA